MPINVELFRKIHHQITTQPETHDQSNWSSRSEDQVYLLESSEFALRLECGSTRCVAGWAVYFHQPDQSIFKTSKELRPESADGDIHGAAAELLGLDETDALALFYASDVQAVSLVRHYADLEDCA